MKTTLRFPAVRAAFVAAAVACLVQATGMPAAMADTAQPFKDLDIRQLPMTEIAPAADTRGSSNTGGDLKVSTTLDRPDGKYKHGDNLSLMVETTEDAYIWVLDTGTSGKVHQLFPNEYETDNFLHAGMPITIPQPDSDYQLAVTHPRGTELITVIASRNNAPLTQGLVDRAMEAGPFLALQGTAVSVSKDLSISLKKNHPDWVGHHQVLYIE